MHFPKIHFFAVLILLFSAQTDYGFSEAWGQSEFDAEQRISELETAVHRLTELQDFERSHDSVQKSLYTGFSFLFARLAYHESFRAMQTNIATGTLNLVPFDYGFELTPRVWLGYRGASGLGVRSSFWQDFADYFVEGTYEGQLWTAGGAPTLTFLGFNGLSLNLGLAL